MTEINRRNIVRGAAWSIPVIAVAATAPAFAASQPITCVPTADCKFPGDGGNSKDYVLRTNCTSTTPITKVEVYDNKGGPDKKGAWVVAKAETDGTYTAYEFNDSRRTREVRLTDKYGQTETYFVDFPPC